MQLPAYRWKIKNLNNHAKSKRLMIITTRYIVAGKAVYPFAEHLFFLNNEGVINGYGWKNQPGTPDNPGIFEPIKDN